MTFLLKLILSFIVFCLGVWLIAIVSIDNSEEMPTAKYLVFIIFPATVSGIVAIWRYKALKGNFSNLKNDNTVNDFTEHFGDFIDYFQILNLDLHFSEAQLRDAYKIQAVRWHPDKNSDIDTTNKMQQINEAYLILKNQSSRKLYEQEYFHYQKFRKQKVSLTQAKLEYVIQNSTLKMRILKSREDAKQLAKQSFDDMLGMSISGGKAILSEVLVRAVLLIGGFIFFTLLNRACN